MPGENELCPEARRKNFIFTRKTISIKSTAELVSKVTLIDEIHFYDFFL
jgi:hypothetical protein